MSRILLEYSATDPSNRSAGAAFLLRQEPDEEEDEQDDEGDGNEDGDDDDEDTDDGYSVGGRERYGAITDITAL